MTADVSGTAQAAGMEPADVLIVGAGPTGLLAANLLAMYGIDVVVVERNAGPVEEPRAIILDDEFSRVLATLGVEPDMREHSFAPVGVHYLSILRFAILKVAGFITPNGFANRSTIWQPKLEEILARNFDRKAPGRLMFQHEMTAFSQSGTGILAEVKDAAGGVHVVAARFLLAADGAKSLVRERLGVAFEGFSAPDQPHVVVDVADDPDGQLPHTKFFCDPRRPCTCVPLPYGMRRFEFFLFPHEDPQAMLEPENLARLFRPYRDFANVQVVRKAVYVFHSRLVSRMQVGPVFLLGDAAHLMPPFGAQGMNSGARDANNLAWKIAAVLSGRGRSKMLKSYELERRDHVSRIIRYSVQMGRLSNITSKPVALCRDLLFGLLNLLPPVRRYFRSMRHMPKPDVSAGLVVGQRSDANDSQLGRPVPRLKLIQRDGGSTTLDDAMGVGFALVAVDVDDHFDPADTNAHQLDPDMPCVRIGLNTTADYSPEDEAGQQWCQQHRGRIFLVRPDRYVAIVEDPAGIGSAIDEFLEMAGDY